MASFGSVLGYAVSFCVLGAVFWLPGFALGRATRLTVRLSGLGRLGEACLALGLWIAVLFLLAALHLLHPVGLWSAVGLAALSAAWVWFRSRGQDWPPSSGPRSGKERFLLTGVILAVLVPWFLIALQPRVAWDAATYHLTLPKLYLAHGGFRAVPFSVFANWPLNVELLFAGAMLAKDYILATLVHFGFGVLTLYAIYVGAREFQRALAGWLAVLLFLANDVVRCQFAIAYVDLAYAFFFVAAFLFLLRALDRPQERPVALLLAGLCGGLLAGVKVNGCVGTGLLAVIYVVGLPLRPRGAFSAGLRPLLSRYALPALLLWCPWLIKSAWYTGNPVYPFLYGWFDGPDWSATLADRFIAWQREIGMGRTPLDYLLLPLRVILQGGPGYEHFDGHISAVWIVLIPLSVVFGWRSRFTRRCLAAAGLYFVLWSLSSQQVRFLIPVLALLAMAVAVTAVNLLERIPWHRVRAAAPAVATLAALAALAYEHVPLLTNGFNLAGFYRETGGPLREARGPVHDFIRRELPPAARLLCLNTNQGFFLDREYLADSSFEASQIAEWLRPAQSEVAMRQRLAERGITHVLIYARGWGISYSAVLLDLLQDENEVRLVFRDPRYAVLELR